MHYREALSSAFFEFPKKIQKSIKKLLTLGAICVNIMERYLISIILRVQFNGRIPAFQAGRVGSIPITRSIFLLCTRSSAGQSNCLLSSRSGVRIPPGTPTTKQWLGVLPIAVRLYYSPKGERTLVGVAQLVRASDCGSEGRGFESHHPPHKKPQPNSVEVFQFYLLRKFYWTSPVILLTQCYLASPSFKLLEANRISLRVKRVISLCIA